MPLLRRCGVPINAGYALGALVLGIRLRELSPQIDRVIVHTDDVPSNYLDAFEEGQSVAAAEGWWYWWRFRSLHKQRKYFRWCLHKARCVDIAGILPRSCCWTSISSHWSLWTSSLDCLALQQWFVVMEKTFMDRKWMAVGFLPPKITRTTQWGQSGGINAGVILLQPDHYLFQQMLSEVSSKNHPCHVAGSGPEQDYLSRFFAARKESPWHHISVAWNYQLHQSLFAIERVLEWTAFMREVEETLFRGRKRVVAREVEDELRGHWCGPLQRRGENVAPNFGSYCYRLFGKWRSDGGKWFMTLATMEWRMMVGMEM